MNTRIKFKNKTIEIKDIYECRGLMKFKGLMFTRKEKASALSFQFKKGRIAIHSFFCPPFLAIWLNKKEIVDYKFVISSKSRILPTEDFTQLIEVPWNKKYKKVINLFLDDKNKHLKTK